MAEKRCPKCFSKLSEHEWTDDPIETPKGEAGENYIGFLYMKPEHIEELQNARQGQEISAGIPEDERTTFTPVRVEGKDVYFYKKHLRELRESTEKILNATGQTKEEYFNYDDEETEYNIGHHQLDWHDGNLNETFIYIKAVHIEDLRHYIKIEVEPTDDWIETWEDAEVKIYREGNGIMIYSESLLADHDWSYDFQITPSGYGKFAIIKPGDETNQLELYFEEPYGGTDNYAVGRIFTKDIHYTISPTTYFTFDTLYYDRISYNPTQMMKKVKLAIHLNIDWVGRPITVPNFLIEYCDRTRFQPPPPPLKSGNTHRIYLAPDDIRNWLARNIYDDLKAIPNFDEAKTYFIESIYIFRNINRL